MTGIEPANRGLSLKYHSSAPQTKLENHVERTNNTGIFHRIEVADVNAILRDSDAHKSVKD
jgi:hypothetical protein